MGMRGSYIAISPARLQAFLSSPDTLDADLDAFIEASYSDPAVPQTDVDKAWNAIHYLLTGNATVGMGERPYTLPILGGQPLGSHDWGYGPILYLTPEETAEAALALAETSRETLAERYDPEAMDAEVYPNIWVRDGKDGFQYILCWYEQLAEFYRQAAVRGDAVLQILG